VIVGGSRGINLDLQFGSNLRQQLPKYALRRRAAADIPEAYEQNPGGHRTKNGLIN
jgi:hypothetical protein